MVSQLGLGLLSLPVVFARSTSRIGPRRVERQVSLPDRSVLSGGLFGVWPVLAPDGSAVLLGVDPGEDGVSAVASVAAEPHVREQPAARVLANPTLGHVQQFGDLPRLEKAIRQVGSSGRRVAL